MTPDTQETPVSERFVMCPCPVFGMPGFRKLRRATGAHALEFWLFLVTVAKEANAAGKILAGREPLGAEELADLHPFDGGEEAWTVFLASAEKVGWLERVEGVFKLTNPMQWYRPPSKMPEAERARWERRSEAKKEQTPQASAGTPQPSAALRTNRTEPDQTEPDQTRPDQTEPRACAREGAVPPVTPRVVGMMDENGFTLGDHVVATQKRLGWPMKPDEASKLRADVNALTEDVELANDATREAIRETLFIQHNDPKTKVKHPAAFAASLFGKHLALAETHRLANDKRAHRGKTATPYRCQVDSEWVLPPPLVPDPLLSQTPLAADLAALPRPRRLEERAQPQELSADTEAMIAAMASRKAIE